MRHDAIVAVRAYLLDCGTAHAADGAAPVPPAGPIQDPPPDHWLSGKVANPMSRYVEFRDNRDAAIGSFAGRTVVVQVESASGATGIGTTSGGLAAAAVIEEHLAYLVRGEQPWAHQRIWDRMYSSTLRYGRKGLVVNAISAVDIAVWDLHGKITDMPVHALAGGRVHDRIRAYATGPKPATAARMGFAGSKLPLVYAPCEGEEGLRRNVELVAKARTELPVDFPIMLDCWMALDVDYAVRLAHAVAPFGVAWLEEPLPPDDYEGLRRLRDRMPPTMMLATGEHEWTAKGFELLCRSGVDLLQPDISWCGGVTELIRIADVAQTHGVKLIPHCGGMFSYHVVAARPELELVEFPVLSPDGMTVTPQHTPLFTGERLPDNGWVSVGDDPGFGLSLNPEVGLVRPVTGP